jgi:crotonobetainyl-CoA:carnitine CoA-transferase CaiB-like acyl-CoA transferase
VAFLVGQHMAVAAISGEAPLPMPERGRAWSVYDLFTTADNEQVFIGVTSERHWQRFCKVFGFSDWTQNEQLASNSDRIDAREWFLPELKSRLSALKKEQLMALAEKANIPFAPVNRPQDLFEDPHMNESGSLVETIMPNGNRAKLPKIPLRLNGSGFGLRSHPPKIGEEYLEFYKRCGLTDDKIDELLDEHVIEISEMRHSSDYLDKSTT